jgi:hypothetical protein
MDLLFSIVWFAAAFLFTAVFLLCLIGILS